MEEQEIINWIAYLSTCSNVKKLEIDKQLQDEISDLDAVVNGNRHTMFRMVNPQQITKEQWGKVLETLEDRLLYMRINFYYGQD